MRKNSTKSDQKVNKQTLFLYHSKKSHKIHLTEIRSKQEQDCRKSHSISISLVNDIKINLADKQSTNLTFVEKIVADE